MEQQTILPQEPKKSFPDQAKATWAAMTAWLSKLFIIIAIVIAFMIVVSLFKDKAPADQNDSGVFIAMVAIIWVALFIIIYALLYLLKNIILAVIILAPVGLAIYYSTISPQKYQTNFFTSQPKGQVEKIDSINHKINMLSMQIDSMNKMILSIKMKTDSMK